MYLLAVINDERAGVAEDSNSEETNYGPPRGPLAAEPSSI
jgi:hypothetical protein